eukprot:COSAG06_NODE_47807_length_336_cov_2.940928_1_plen_94_part_01
MTIEAKQKAYSLIVRTIITKYNSTSTSTHGVSQSHGATAALLRASTQSNQASSTVMTIEARTKAYRLIVRTIITKYNSTSTSTHGVSQSHGAAA